MLCKELRRAALAKDPPCGHMILLGDEQADKTAIAAVEEDIDLFITEMQRVGVVMQLAWVSLTSHEPVWRVQHAALTVDGARRWL